MIVSSGKRITTLALGLVVGALTACSDGATNEPADDRLRVVLASPQVIHVSDGLRVVPETLVIEVRNRRGELAPYATVSRGATTGWLRDLRTSDWSRAGIFNADSTGRIRFLWQPSGTGTQTLEFSSYSDDVADHVVRSFTLLRPAVTLRADSVVPSGLGAVCFQQGGRIGCAGEGKCFSCADSALTLRSFDRVHWFRLKAPPLSLTSTLGGACALLIDGNTACWDGLGPDSVAQNDIGHPPFVELRGSIGRTADGAVWKGVLSGPTGYAHVWSNRSWNLVPSDSAMSELLWDFNETFVCARTAAGAVMCTTADRGLLEPSVIMQPFRPLRWATDSTVTRATGGYTAVLYEGADFYASVVVRTPEGINYRFAKPQSRADGWYAQPVTDSSLSGPDPRNRACVPALDPLCDGSGPWRDVAVSGRTYYYGFRNTESGFRRVCGVRDVIVCQLRLNGGQRYSPFQLITTDTIRLAP